MLELTRDDLEFLEDSLQRDAVAMLASARNAPVQTYAEVMATPAYRKNREMFGRVWDALYADQN